MCYIVTMKGEKFILYSNRKSNVHVFKYVNPEGKEFDLDSRKLPKGWNHKLSGHHALVRASHDLETKVVIEGKGAQPFFE